MSRESGIDESCVVLPLPHPGPRYARYDNKPSFDGFKPFGGWSQPSMKQFAGDVTVSGEYSIYSHTCHMC